MYTDTQTHRHTHTQRRTPFDMLYFQSWTMLLIFYLFKQLQTGWAGQNCTHTHTHTHICTDSNSYECITDTLASPLLLHLICFSTNVCVHDSKSCNTGTLYPYWPAPTFTVLLLCNRLPSRCYYCAIAYLHGAIIVQSPTFTVLLLCNRLPSRCYYCAIAYLHGAIIVQSPTFTVL